MKPFTILLCLLLDFQTHAQGPTLGKISNDLAFDKIMNFERDKGHLSDFKDKVVILDFWATWCAPCLQSFPTLEALQDQFDREIQILTITDDSVERIQHFLELRKMKLPVVIDEKKELANYFPHGTIPHVVVIDKSGIIRAITTTSEITEALIHKILLNQPIDLKEKQDVINFDPSLTLSGDVYSTYQVTITPYKNGFPTYSNDNFTAEPYKERRILATNLSARSLFEIAHQFPPGIRTIVEVTDLSKFEWSQENAICFDLIVPQVLGKDRFEIMQQQLSIYFRYQTVVEERMMPVKVLRNMPGSKKLITESKKGTESYNNNSRKGLSMKASPIKSIVDFLENYMKKAIVDETNLDGLYDAEIPWFHERPELIHVELEKLGLEMVDTERTIKVLVIKDI